MIFDGYKYSRDQVFALLHDNGIIARKYFYPVTNAFECYQGLPGFDPGLTPVAGYMADRVLTLPLYPELPLEQVDRICRLILE